MGQLTIDDIDALVGPATPHFAFQIRARLREAIAGLAEDDAVRAYAEQKISLLESLGYASSKAEHAEHPDARKRPGWAEIPSAANAAAPLPRHHA